MATPPINRLQIAYPDKLDGKNWNDWKRCMMNAFDLHGLRKVVENGFTIEYATNSTTTYTEDTKTNKTLDIMAQNLILTNMLNTFSVIIDGCENSKDMWKALLNRFEGNMLNT